MKHLETQPSEIEKMPYWEYEEMVELLSDYIKKQNAANKSQQEPSGNSYSKDAGKILKNVPKPSMPSLKMPSFKR